MSPPAYQRHGVTVLAGDCLDVLRELDDASVDAVVTDPPYGLGFMGHEWDQPGDYGALRANGRPGVHRRGPDREQRPISQGSMEAGRYDQSAAANTRFAAWCAAWAAECLRVLRPGGHLLAFGAPRTGHRLAAGIEDAGFEIRDTIMWIYGSGFPKSLDVSKAIDKAAGAERQVIGSTTAGASSLQRVSRVEQGYRDRLTTCTPEAIAITAPATDAAQQWQGWGTALKPAQEPIVVARKPLSGTVAQTVLAHGTGALNIDACRVGTVSDGPGSTPRSTTGGARGSMAGAMDRVGYDGSAGRWPSNVVLTHAPDCTDGGTCAAAAGCPVAALDQQSGVLKSGAYKQGTRADGAVYNKFNGENPGHEASSGGASRFFPVFRWEAKAPTSERPQVDGISHPTVKPIDLMRWLVRLVTPAGGLVLDPFAGSGTTLHAARAEGMRAIGIEREPDYLRLIAARLDARPRQAEVAAVPVPDGEPMDLLDLLGGEAS